MDLGYDQVASKLLQDRLLLTALELHLELTEAGRELACLKDFFSNPSNFERQARPDLSPTIARSHSQATLDSLDLSRFSEDGADPELAVDERVAVLEFELRRARESIGALRANLTVAAAGSSVSSPSLDAAAGLGQTQLRPHQQRALNFLVNEYLLQHGYRLTAVTFCEENSEQDLDEWEDAGLGDQRPPELSALYNEACSRGWGGTRRETACQTAIHGEHLHQQTEQLKEVSEQLRVELETERVRCKDLQQRLTSLKNIDHEKLPEVITQDISKDTEDETKEVVAEVPEEERCSGGSSSVGEHFEIVEHLPTSSLDGEWTQLEVAADGIRQLPATFRRAVLNFCGETQERPEELEGQNDLSAVLASLLPNLLPTLPGPKREELLPLVALTARLQIQDEPRAQLLTLLLSSRKRPQPAERKAVLEALKGLAKDPRLVEEHVLPQVWELASHKTVERRLLAAEACCSLAPLVSPHARESLLLPLLQQLLLEAPEDEVRESVVRSLGMVVALLVDQAKYFQCEELCLAGLEDTSNRVRACTASLLLPALAQWASYLQRLHTHLLTRLLARLKVLLRDPRAPELVQALQSLLPFLLVSLASSGEPVARRLSQTVPEPRPDLAPLFSGLCDPALFHSSPPSAWQLLAALDACLSEEWVPSWPQLEWLTEQMLPQLYELLCALDVNNDTMSAAFVRLFHFICRGLGRSFTEHHIKPLFVSGLRQLESWLEESKHSSSGPSLLVIPVLLVSVLTTGEPRDCEELSALLRRLLVSLPLCNVTLAPLRYSVTHLARAPALQPVLLAALSETAGHARPVVRVAVAELLSCLVASMPPQQPPPAPLLGLLAKVAADHHAEVREATVPLLAQLIITSPSQEAQEQSRATLQAFLQDCPDHTSHGMTLALARALASIVGLCDPAFREHMVLPQLARLTEYCLHHSSSQTRRMDLGLALVSGLSAASHSQLSRHSLSSILVPALRNLEIICAQCLVAHHDAVGAWLRETESRCELPTPVGTPSSPDKTASGHPLVLSAMSSASAVGRSVEDVRQKVSSLLRKK